MKTYIPVLQQDQTFAVGPSCLLAWLPFYFSLVVHMRRCQAGPLQGLPCPGCLQKEYRIVYKICNSLVDFLHVSHELCAFKGMSTHMSHMVLLGWPSWKKVWSFQNTFTINFLLLGGYLLPMKMFYIMKITLPAFCQVSCPPNVLHWAYSTGIWHLQLFPSKTLCCHLSTKKRITHIFPANLTRFDTRNSKHWWCLFKHLKYTLLQHGLWTHVLNRHGHAVSHTL